MREPHFGTIKQLWETCHEGTFKELKETYYEGSPLWVFYSDQVELKLEILSELEFNQLNPKLESGHYWQTNIVNVMLMVGQTLARRSMQNPEQHWKSSDVSLARPVSFAPLCNNPISCFCLVTGLYPSTKFVRTYLYFFPRKLSLINEIKVGQKKGFNGAQYFFFTFTCHCFLRAIF